MVPREAKAYQGSTPEYGSETAGASHRTFGSCIVAPAKMSSIDVQITDDRLLSPLPPPSGAAATAAFPVTARAGDAELFCMYRWGTTKHSPDGVLVGQRSIDGGASWLEPVLVADLTGEDRPETVLCGQLAATAPGALLATFTTIVVEEPAGHSLGRPGTPQQRGHYRCISRDGGATWTVPGRVLEITGERSAFLGQSVVLSNGELFLPVGRWGPNGIRIMAACYSRDGGKSLDGPHDIVTDPRGERNFDDPCFTVFPDGEIMGLFWTHDRRTEETLEVHRSCSTDQGRTWSSPAPVGFRGQISAPLAIGDSMVLAASNFRWDPPGIRLWLSLDRGRSFGQTPPVEMWDAAQERMVCPRNDGIWDALEHFSFGTPGLTRLTDTRYLLTYYATVDGHTHIRSCRFDYYPKESQ